MSDKEKRTNVRSGKGTLITAAHVDGIIKRDLWNYNIERDISLQQRFSGKETEGATGDEDVRKRPWSEGRIVVVAGRL